MAINHIIERKQIQSQSLSLDQDGESRAPAPRRGYSPRDTWRAAATLSVVLLTLLFGRRAINTLSQHLFPQHQGMFNLRSLTHVGCIDQPDIMPCRTPILPPEPLDSYLALCIVVRDDGNNPSGWHITGVWASALSTYLTTEASRRSPNGCQTRASCVAMFTNSTSTS